MSSSTYSGVLTNKNTNGLPFIQPSSGLYVRLINTDTQETVASSNPTDGNGYYETPRPSTGTYGVWVCQTIDGTFVFTGEQVDVFNTANMGSGVADPTSVHLAGPETITGVKTFSVDANFQNAYRKGPVTDADHPDFGTPGTDAALQAALSYMASRGGGELILTPGRTYSTAGITAISNLAIKAKGAIIQHTGSGILIRVGQNSTSIKHFELHGGFLIANQTVGTTTDIVYVQNANYCTIDPDLIQGGNDPTNPTVFYAQNGMHIYGQKFPIGGNYYNTFGGVRGTLITGCANAGVFVDGWDTANSPTSGSYCNNNLFQTLLCQSNQVGILIDGAENNVFLNGDCERNTSFGLVMGGHPMAIRFVGIWIESNNGGTANDQISVDTATYAPSQQSNVFQGSGNTSTQAYWKEFSSPSSQNYAGPVKWAGTPTQVPSFNQSTINNPVLAAYLSGDAQPQFRLNVTGSGAQFKLGPGGSTTPDCTFGRTGTATVGNPTGTTLQSGGFFFPPNLGPAAQGSVGLYAGNGVPSNSLGANGSFYLRGDGGGVAASNLYLKVNGAWVGIA